MGLERNFDVTERQIERVVDALMRDGTIDTDLNDVPFLDQIGREEPAIMRHLIANVRRKMLAMAEQKAAPFGLRKFVGAYQRAQETERPDGINIRARVTKWAHDALRSARILPNEERVRAHPKNREDRLAERLIYVRAIEDWAREREKVTAASS